MSKCAVRSLRDVRVLSIFLNWTPPRWEAGKYEVGAWLGMAVPKNLSVSSYTFMLISSNIQTKGRPPSPSGMSCSRILSVGNGLELWALSAWASYVALALGVSANLIIVQCALKLGIIGSLHMAERLDQYDYNCSPWFRLSKTLQ